MIHRYIVFLLIIVFSFACKKEEVHPFVFGAWGEASSERTGNLISANSTWNAKTNTFPLETDFCDNCFGITFSLLDESDLLREKIVFDYLPLRVGKFNSTKLVLQEPSIARTTFETSEGDLITGLYSIVEENDNNYIEITSIMKKKSETIVDGKFAGTYIRRDSWTIDSIPPDTIYIKGGVFEGRLPND